jgi:glycine/D-amino acid oxidase-like deaminating enzyme
MRVAIVGAGLAGLSVTWHLSKLGVQTVLFDPKGIGGGASGVSTGLLHPFPGKKALRSWGAAEGMEATFALLQISEEALGKRVADRSGIFRPAITEQQKADFFSCAEKDPEGEWKEIPIAGTTHSGLWIAKGVCVFSQLYLEGLWRACEKRGADFVRASYRPADFDAVVFAAGHEILRFFPDLPLKTAIGQTLLCRWKTPLPFSLVSQGHITPTEDPAFCQVGSTYEHTPEPTPALALALLDKASIFHPPAKEFEIVERRSGVRIAPREGYRPIAGKAAPKTWIFTGLGSRGMLYHASLGAELAEAIVANRDSFALLHKYKATTEIGTTEAKGFAPRTPQKNSEGAGLPRLCGCRSLWLKS